MPVIISHTKFPYFNDHLGCEETDELIRKGMTQMSLDYIRDNTTCKNVHSSQLLHNLVRHWQEQVETDASAPLYNPVADVYIKILNAQRDYLYKLNKENPNIDENIIRH